MPSKSKDILGGFRIHWMGLRDADTGKILWQVNNYCIVDQKRRVKGESLSIDYRATMTFQFQRMSMRQGCQRRFWNAEQCQGWLGCLPLSEVVDHISLSLCHWKCSHWLYSGKSISPRWNPWKSSDWNRRFFSRYWHTSDFTSIFINLSNIPSEDIFVLFIWNWIKTSSYWQGRCLEEWNFDFGWIFDVRY